MRMFSCESSLIAAYGYAPEAELLEIEFHRGGRYRYRNVGEAKFLEFLRASSKGKYFIANIKGSHDAEKL